MKQFTFPKSEHLCHRSDIERLFAAQNESAVVYPLRAVWRVVAFTPEKDEAKVQVLLSVSKRKLRHAVERNRTKRQLREAYRLRKDIVIESVPEDKKLHLAFMWLSDKTEDSARIHKAMEHLLMKISKAVYTASL